MIFPKQILNHFPLCQAKYSIGKGAPNYFLIHCGFLYELRVLQNFTTLGQPLLGERYVF